MWNQYMKNVNNFHLFLNIQSHNGHKLKKNEININGILHTAHLGTKPEQ